MKDDVHVMICDAIHYQFPKRIEREIRTFRLMGFRRNQMAVLKYSDEDFTRWHVVPKVVLK